MGRRKKNKFNTGSGLLRRHDLGNEARRLGRQVLSRRRRRAACVTRGRVDGVEDNHIKQDRVDGINVPWRRRQAKFNTESRLERADDRRTGVTSPEGANSAPMPTAFVGLNCWGVAPRDPAAGVAARRAESARFSARSWRDRASGVVAMGDGASMSAGSSPTVGAAASRRRCAWRLAFFA